MAYVDDMGSWLRLIHAVIEQLVLTKASSVSYIRIDDEFYGICPRKTALKVSDFNASGTLSLKKEGQRVEIFKRQSQRLVSISTQVMIHTITSSIPSSTYE